MSAKNCHHVIEYGKNAENIVIRRGATTSTGRTGKRTENRLFILCVVNLWRRRQEGGRKLPDVPVL